MKTFLEYCENLVEKQIQYNRNANYGQIVFFAGGAASGKGFAGASFIDSAKFKVRDVDSLKSMLLKWPRMIERYPEIKDLDLRRPDDVFKLHAIAKKENLPEKQFNALVTGMRYPETLPNILFDTTMKDLDDLHAFVPVLLQMGYKPENVHITWVLADYAVAVERNKQRDRVVPDDILLKTHRGAAVTMKNLLSGQLPKYVNGSITVILNNIDQIQYYDKEVVAYKKADKFSPTHSGEVLKKDGKVVKYKTVKDFLYITLKQAGKPMPALQELDKHLKETLYRWVLENAPRTDDVFAAYASR